LKRLLVQAGHALRIFYSPPGGLSREKGGKQEFRSREEDRDKKRRIDGGRVRLEG
jgi:hypothetical protein